MDRITILAIIAIGLIFRCIYLENKIKAMNDKGKSFHDYLRCWMNIAAQSVYRCKGDVPECEEDVLNLDDEISFTLSGVRHEGWITMAEPENKYLMDMDNPFEIAYFCDEERTPRRIRLDYVKDIKLLRHRNSMFMSKYDTVEELKERNLL